MFLSRVCCIWNEVWFCCYGLVSLTEIGFVLFNVASLFAFVGFGVCLRYCWLLTLRVYMFCSVLWF